MDEPVSRTRAIRWSSVALGALGAALTIYALASRCLGDPDLGWHLATGRSITLHAAIPRVDDLAIAHAPVRYVVAVSDVLLHLVERTFGLLGLQIFGALVASGTAALVFFTGRRSPAALIASALVLAALNAWVSPSAAPLSYPLLAGTMLLVDRHRQSKRPPWAFVPLLFVWANTHGSVAIGAAIVVTYALTRRTLPTILVAVAAVLAATLNPGGARVLLATARFGESLGNVTEWKAPTLALLLEHEPVILVIVALGLAALAFGRERAELFDVLAVLGSIAGITQMTRMIPLAAIVIAPIAARRLGHLVPRTPAMALASSAATVASGAFLFLTSPTARGVGFDRNIFPVAATSFVVHEAKPAGRMWNFWPFGGYLAWRLGPEREVLVDGRNTLAHDRTLVERADASVVDNVAFEKLVDEFDLQWAITRASTAEPLFGAGVARSKRFAMIYFDDVAAVYVRKDGPNDALASDGYRILRHDTPPASMLAIATGPNAAARQALAHDGELAWWQNNENVRATFAFACGAIAVQDDKKLGSAVETLKRLGADPLLIEALSLAASRTPPSSPQP